MLKKIFPEFKNFIFSKKFLAVLLIIAVSAVSYFFLNFKKKEPVLVTNSNLPYKEKVGEGVWALKNYDPVKQTLASTKVNTNLVENKNAIKSSITNPSDIDIYRWSVTLPNKTVFAFGQQLKDGIFPAVKVTNKDGLSVKYYPESFNGFVKPTVKGNVIEWEIANGIKARYTMMQDRVKADYVVNEMSNIQCQISNDKCSLEFDVQSGQIDAKSLIMEKMPNGNISVLNKENLQEVFTIPAPIVKDAKGKEIEAEYGLKGNSLSITLSKNGLANAVYPVTIDPVVIDAAAAATSTAYGNGRKILRDGWGNLIALFDGGVSDDSVWYKNYSATTWTDANIDLDAGAGSSVEIAADLDSTGSAHLAFRNTTASAIQYKPLKVNRDGSNLITSITTQASFSLDTSTFGARPSLIVANKDGGAGVEKIAIAYGMNSTGAGRGEIRFMQCDVADDCTSVANWKNASEEINGSGTCSDTATSGAAGLPTSATCKGTSDKLFNAATNTTHHGLITQMPGKPKRTPTNAKMFDGASYTNLTNALDDNISTTASVGGLDTNDYLYIGDNNTFSNLIVDLTDFNNDDTSDLSYFSLYQYCSVIDGSNNCTTWSSLSNFFDYTRNEGTTIPDAAFFKDGSILFDEPADWKSSIVDGQNRYWIRLRPNYIFFATVTVAEFDITDRNSRALAVIGGIDSGDGLGVSYVAWDFINNDRWENHFVFTTSGSLNHWRQGSTAIDALGGNWTQFTNFPLSATVDYKNNSIFVSYVEDLATDVLHVKKAPNNLDLSIAANWIDTGFPTVTEAADIVLSLTSDGSDIYLFYVLDPGTNSLVFRKCTPSGGGDGNKCDNSADWGSEKTLVSGTDLSHPQAVVTKVTGDTVAIDTIYTMPTALDVVYERHYVDLADKTVVVAVSGDDASQYTGGSQVINGTVDVGFTGLDNGGPLYSNGGIRFPNVTVSQGAKISSAYIDIQINSDANTVKFDIYGDDTDNSSAFLAVSSPCDSTCITGRTRTASLTSTSSTNYRTQRYRFDVTDIIQELVCRGAANTQPCIGDFNGSGNWVSGYAISILLINNGSIGGLSSLPMSIASNDTAGDFDPTLQINVAPSGTTGKIYSLGSATQLATGSASFADLDHPLSSVEILSVATDDTNYASVSATVNYASQSAVPAFMFKVNNSNNDNTYKIDAQAIVKSTVPTSSKPIYLQVYRGGSTDDWITMASNNNTAADTDVTLTSSQITASLSEYYFNETPGIGTRYAECTTATANCWSYWRLYQGSVGTDQNAVLSLDYVSISFSSGAAEVPSAKLKGGVIFRGGSKIK